MRLENKELMPLTMVERTYVACLRRNRFRHAPIKPLGPRHRTEVDGKRWREAGQMAHTAGAGEEAQEEIIGADNSQAAAMLPSCPFKVFF